MDTFNVIKSKPVSDEKALEQLDAFIIKEKDARSEETDIANTTRARINDDILTQIETSANSLRISTSHS